LIILKVLVVSRSLAERLMERLPNNIEIIKPKKGTDEELISLTRDVEVIVSTRLSSRVAESASNLRLLQKTGAGVDDMPFKSLSEDTWVANTSGSNPVPLAEGAVALVLALAKRVMQRNHNFRKGPDGVSGVFLSGKTAGIIGFGSIGREVAKRLNCLEMNIMALKRHPDPELKKSMGLKFLGVHEDLETLLSESDFVVITVPLTPETRGMIGKEEISLMKSSAFIVNVARAAIIQEEPLYHALKNGLIAGAALDVWWKPHWWDPIWNPNGENASLFPFWELPNVICTPHNIVSTDQKSEASLDIIVENILRVRDGEAPINLVDKELQY
jgi:phosphoglycerate dehydrogenase-like enzyme